MKPNRLLLISYEKDPVYCIVEIPEELYQAPGAPRINRIEIENEVFLNSIGEKFCGFYDGLRNSKSQLVGIRLNLLVDVAGLEEVLNNNGIDFIGTGIEIYWTPEHKYEDSLSGDQAFSYSSVFLNTNKAIGVFTLDALNSLDITLLEHSDLKKAKNIKFF
jgi:hypothetical protein